MKERKEGSPLGLFPLDRKQFEDVTSAWIDELHGDDLSGVMKALEAFKTVNPTLYDYLTVNAFPRHFCHSDPISRLLNPYRFASVTVHEVVRRICEMKGIPMPVVTDEHCKIATAQEQKFMIPGNNPSHDVYAHGRAQFFETFYNANSEFIFPTLQITEHVIGQLPHPDHELRKYVRSHVQMGIIQTVQPLRIAYDLRVQSN